MDQTKFRAWDGTKMWKHAVPILGKAYNGGTINVSDQEDGGFNKFINGILLQFTGLVDCEGKEIWESDIIEEFGVKAFRRVVAWDTENAAWGYKGKHKNYNWAHEWGESQGATLQSMKIIGNIYEHPQLLNNES
jgi:uncharacterized phage protein (TIGR01671 family)